MTGRTLQPSSESNDTMSPSESEKLEDYRGFLLTLARRQLGVSLRPKVSESDIVQLTFLNAHNNFESYRGASDQELRGWLASILHNQCFNERERYFASQKRDITRERADLSSLLTSDDPSASTALVSVETIDRLLAAMQKLSPEQRDIIQLRNIEQIGMEDISQRLGINRHIAYRRWKSALKALGALLKE